MRRPTARAAVNGDAEGADAGDRRQAIGDESAAAPDAAPDDAPPGSVRDDLIHRDNTFGTPEEDAFRRDFTVNALFYDIATFSVIDYVGGLEDLQARVIRSIGDPEVRFHEDPVRMLRAIVLAARLGFTVDPPVVEAIRAHAREIERSAPARMIEEFYKILRSGRRSARSTSWRRSGCCAGSRRSSSASASRSGRRSPPSIATAGASTRRPTR
jgi:poly(A) polymerase